MAIFPKISSLLKELSVTNLPALKEVLRVLPENHYEEYISSVEAVNGKDEKSPPVMEWLLANYFIHSGFVELRIFLGKKEIYHLGARILSGEPQSSRSELKSGDETLNYLGHLYRSYQDDHLYGVLEIEAVVPREVLLRCNPLMQRIFLPLATNYFAFSPRYHPEWFVDDLYPVEHSLSQALEQEIDLGRKVTLTHFHVQDLSVYFNLMGEWESQEIIETITGILRENTKKTDQIYRLSTRSILVLAPGMDSRVMEKRFNHVFFQYKELVFDYQLYSHTIREYPVNLYEIFKKLKVISA